jgi:hypothetical protein
MPGNLQRGLQRSGVSGTTINIANQTAVFHGDTLRWNLRDSRSVKARRGRGLSNRYSQYRYLYADGGGVLLVKRIEGDWPGPANIEHTGSITYTIHNSRTIVVPIRITEFAPSEDPTKQDDVIAQVSYVTTGPPVFSGWSGTQPTSTAPTASDMQLWEGTVFAKDPQGLTSNSQITVDWWDTAVGDSNAAEVAKLDAKINTFLAPFTGMKLRTASFTRDSTDGGTIVFACGLTDTKDDIENPESILADDPQDLQDSDTQTLVTTSATAPGVPAPRRANLVHRATVTVKLNDFRWKHSFQYAVRDSKADIELLESPTIDDPLDLEEEATRTRITDSATAGAPPTVAGFLHRKTISVQQTQVGKWKHTFVYGVRTTQDDIEFEGSEIVEDSLNLADEATQTVVTTSANPPAAPNIPGFVFRRVRTKRLTRTSNKYRHTYEYGTRTTVGDVEMPQSPLGDDPYDLEDEAKITRVSQSEEPDAPPPAPVGEHIRTVTTRLNDGNWQHSYEYGNTNSNAARKFQDAAIDDDASDLKDTDVVKDVNGSSTPPGTPTPRRDANLQLIRRVSVRLTNVPQQWLHAFYFGRNTNQDKIELDGTRTNQDPDDFGETAEITRVTTSVNPPATPAAPVGQLIETETHPITQASGSYTGRWKHTFKYGPTTKKQEIEFSGETAADPRFLNDTDAVPIVSLSSAPPAVPTPNVPGLKFRRRRSTRLQGTPEKWKHVFEFARTDSVDDVVNPQTFTDTDVSGLKSSARRLAVFQPDGTGPTAPTVPGFVRLNSGNVKPLNDAWSVIIWDYGLSTTQQEQEFAESEASDDPRLLDQQADVAVIAGATQPATPTPPFTGLKLISVARKQRTAQTNKWRWLFKFGPLDTADKFEFEETIAVGDTLDNFQNKISTVVTNSGTAAQIAAALLASNQGDLSFEKAMVRKLTPTQALQTLFFSGDNKKLLGGAPHTYEDSLRGRPPSATWHNDGSFGSPTCLVRVLVPGVGSIGGFTYGDIVPIKVYRTKNNFRLRRRIATTTPVEQFGYQPQIGTVSAQDFLGWPKHMVMYNGPSIIFNYSMPGAHLAIFDYDFTYDSERWINDGEIPIGRAYIVNQGGPFLGVSNFYDVLFFDPLAGLRWPSTSDFSVFTN